MPPSVEEVVSSLDKLNVSANTTSKSKSQKTEVADSWEDEADESFETEVDVPDLNSSKTSRLPKEASSPTSGSSPSSKGSSTTFARDQAFDYDVSFGRLSSRTTPGASITGSERRPEKSTAVAARLIAAGIGQKAPRRTQEQRDYDRAMRVQEKRRRDEAKEAEQEKTRAKEQAQRDVWGD